MSRLFGGQFREYSVERLMGSLTAFEQDVEIVVLAPASQGGRGWSDRIQDSGGLI